MAIKELDQDYVQPPLPPGPLKWARENLFSSILNSILTLILFPGVLYLLYLVFHWILIEADWRAVVQFPLLYAVGQYPREELWRVGVVFSGLIFMLGISWGRWGGLLRSIALVAGGLLLIVAILPVQHPALTLDMRLYLGSNLLITLVGFLIGKRTPLKSYLIFILWIMIPVIGIVTPGRVPIQHPPASHPHNLVGRVVDHLFARGRGHPVILPARGCPGLWQTVFPARCQRFFNSLY